MIVNLFTDGKIENIEPVTEELVEETILSFKNGKSPDEMHITAEHLKYFESDFLESFRQLFPHCSFS
jgi:hypothetical protein